MYEENDPQKSILTFLTAYIDLHISRPMAHPHAAHPDVRQGDDDRRQKQALSQIDRSARASISIKV